MLSSDDIEMVALGLTFLQNKVNRREWEEILRGVSEYSPEEIEMQQQWAWDYLTTPGTFSTGTTTHTYTTNTVVYIASRIARYKRTWRVRVQAQGIDLIDMSERPLEEIHNRYVFPVPKTRRIFPTKHIIYNTKIKTKAHEYKKSQWHRKTP